MTEPAHFGSRAWTQADDDKLRRLALTGLSSGAIGIRMNRTETAVRSRARRRWRAFPCAAAHDANAPLLRAVASPESSGKTKFSSTLRGSRAAASLR